MPCVSTDDFSFLTQLTHSRDQLIAQLSLENTSFETICASHLQFAREAQAACIAGDFGFFENAVTLCDYDFSIKGKPTDQLMTSGLYHKKLRKTAPFFYELCGLYFDSFDSLTKDQADARLADLRTMLLEAFPEMERILRNYYKYYLLQSYLDIFETYSFVKTISIGILHTHLLTLFLGLYWEKHHSLSRQEQARIISAYERLIIKQYRLWCSYFINAFLFQMILRICLHHKCILG